jgi:hypothetical protein
MLSDHNAHVSYFEENMNWVNNEIFASHFNFIKLTSQKLY